MAKQADINVVAVEIKNLEKNLEREIEEREKDVDDLKDNYVKRFDKVDTILATIFTKINSTNKLIVGLFIFLMTSYMGATVFLILNKIYSWL